MPSMIVAHILTFGTMHTRRTFALASKESENIAANCVQPSGCRLVKYLLSDSFNAFVFEAYF